MNTSDLVGVWTLEAFVLHFGARESRPFGERPVGRLHLADNGEMLVSIFAENHCSFAQDDMQASSLEEAAGAFRRSVTYFGRWSFDPLASMLITEVHGSLFPNWRGTFQKRLVTLTGTGHLTLTTPPVPWQGAAQRGELRWSRVP